jgi:alpha-L-fucosidase
MRNILLLLIFVSTSTFSKTTDKLFFKDRLEKITNNNIFKTEGYYNWGTSIIKGNDNKYHLFYARWKKEYKFTGWLTKSEVAHAVSDNPYGPWKYVETALEGRGGKNWDAITAHNPKIKKFNGKYYLYYISTHMDELSYNEAKLIEISTTGYSHKLWKVLRNNQRTGVAVSNSINGPWKRLDNPIIEPTGPISTLTVNPAITQKNGKYYLIVKGDKPGEKRFIRNQAVAVSDSPIGPFKMQPKPVIDYMDTEDMSIWYNDKLDYFYGVFHAHHFIGMVSSADGINWKKATEYALMPKRIDLKDGSFLKPHRFERPFMFYEDGEEKVLCLAATGKDESYSIFIPIKPKGKRPIPNKRQLAWQKAELGAVFHYDLHVFDGEKYGQGNNRISPVPNYQIFNPKNLDTDQWVKAAKDANCKFAILTATHETGFALYQSDVNPYCLKAVNWRNGKGDIVRDFVNSCKKYGIKPGIYLGIRWNSFFGVHDFKVNGEGEFQKQRQKYYNSMVEGMVKEICTRYGDLFEIWFDGGADHPDNGAPDVLPIIQRYQPNCLFYHNSQYAEARWGGSESGKVPYPCWSSFPNHYSHAGDTQAERYKYLKHGDINGKYWMPAMSDAPLRGYNGRHEWFWEPGDEKNVYPLKNLMDMYYESVGHNSTLIIGLTPNPNGLLDKTDVNRLKEWGDEINRRFHNPIASSRSNSEICEIKLNKSQEINTVIIQENISKGESVREYNIDAKIEGKWQTIASGTCIGNKRIQKFKTVNTNSVRLKILKSDTEIDIPTFSLHLIRD